MERASTIKNIQKDSNLTLTYCVGNSNGHMYRKRKLWTKHPNRFLPPTLPIMILDCNLGKKGKAYGNIANSYLPACMCSYGKEQFWWEMRIMQ